MPWLRNKQTGERVFVPDNPQQAMGPSPIRVQQAQAGIGETQAGTNLKNVQAGRTGVQTQGDVIANRVAGATLPDVIRRTKAEANKAESEANLAQFKDKQQRQKYEHGKASAIDSIKSVIRQLDLVYNDSRDNPVWQGLGETGFLGSVLGKIPGMPAYDLRSELLMPESKAFTGALTEMRQNSPTGAAVGNVTEAEGKKLGATIGNLDPDVSQPTFEQNLKSTRDEWIKMLHRIDPAEAKAIAPLGSGGGTIDFNDLP